MSYIDGLQGWVHNYEIATVKDSYGLKEGDFASDGEPRANNSKDVTINAQISGTEVRMRSGPSLNDEILDYFYKGEAVYIIEEVPGWYRVRRHGGLIGWVSADFCKKWQKGD